jgi:hypothetical protein
MSTRGNLTRGGSIPTTSGPKHQPIPAGQDGQDGQAGISKPSRPSVASSLPKHIFTHAHSHSFSRSQVQTTTLVYIPFPPPSKCNTQSLPSWLWPQPFLPRAPACLLPTRTAPSTPRPLSPSMSPTAQSLRPSPPTARPTVPLLARPSPSPTAPAPSPPQSPPLRSRLPPRLLSWSSPLPPSQLLLR